MGKVKQVKFGTESIGKILPGINKISEVVGSTMGTFGRDVIMDNDNDMPPTISNDGVTIAQQIFFKDKWENIGAKLCHYASGLMNAQVGDGTSTVTVIFAELVKEGYKLLQADYSPIYIREGMNLALKEIEKILPNYIKQITDKDRKKIIKQIAKLSSGNEEIAQELTDLFDKLSEDSIITIEDSIDGNIGSEVLDGIRVDGALTANNFFTNANYSKGEVDNPLILTINDKVNDFKEMANLLGYAVKNQKSVAIFAKDFSIEVLKNLLINRDKMGLIVLPIKIKAPSEKIEDILNDIAHSTKSKLFDNKTNNRISNLEPNQIADSFGHADKIVSTKTESSIFTNSDFAILRIEELKEQLENTENLFEKDNLKERIANLGAGIGVIKIGAYSEVEQRELRYKAEDAIHAVKSAIKNGYTITTSNLFIKINNDLKCNNDNREIQAGFDIIKKVLLKPLKNVVNNANGKFDLIENDIINEREDIGWNANTFTMCNLFNEGIIDPADASKKALQNAISVARTVLCGGAIIATDDENNDKK